MVKIIEKIKNFFCGKFVCKVKKPAQPAGGEEPQPKADQPEADKTEQKPQEQK
ncbi:MAG: hypothetical protein KJ593_02345 [Candidatus Omnitrophica bacterium]|nr:hypothetical protein [Candidatus Omnitrophota bacterium]